MLRSDVILVLVFVVMEKLNAERSATTNSGYQHCCKLPSYHYLDEFSTPLVHTNNKLPPPDNLKKLFKEGGLKNMEDFKTYANQFVVLHLTNIHNFTRLKLNKKRGTLF